MKPFISFPEPVSSGIHVHNQSHSFRGLVKHWERLGLVELQTTKNPFVWWGKPGGVLLYEWDTLEHLTENVRYEVGLFGNPHPPLNGKVNVPWIYWPRCTATILQYHRLGSPSYHERKIRSIFVGGYENMMQRGHRPSRYWGEAVDRFEWCIRGGNYSASEYVRMLRSSRFGLCLRGNGGKCHREVELMAMGCVPILTPDVDLSYDDPPMLGRHFLMARSAEEFADLVETISVEQWTAMSIAGREWYRNNASPDGSFEATRRIVERVTSV